MSDNQKQPMRPVAIGGDGDPTGNLRSFYEGVRHGTPVYPDLLDGNREAARDLGLAGEYVEAFEGIVTA